MSEMAVTPTKAERQNILVSVKQAIKAAGVLHQFFADKFYMIHEHKIWQDEAETLGEWLHENGIDPPRFYKLVSLGKMKALGGPEVRKVLNTVSERNWRVLDPVVKEDEKGNVTNTAEIVGLIESGRDMPFKAFDQTVREHGEKAPLPVDLDSPIWMTGIDGVIGSVKNVHPTRDREGHIVVMALDNVVFRYPTPHIFFHTNADAKKVAD